MVLLLTVRLLLGKTLDHDDRSGALILSQSYMISQNVIFQAPMGAHSQRILETA
jgi:hypothetical protein